MGVLPRPPPDGEFSEGWDRLVFTHVVTELQRGRALAALSRELVLSIPAWSVLAFFLLKIRISDAHLVS